MIFVFGNLWASHLVVIVTLQFLILNNSKLKYTISLVLECLILAVYFVNKIKQLAKGNWEISGKFIMRIGVLFLILLTENSQLQSFLAGSYMQLMMQKEPIYLRIVNCLVCMFYFIMWGEVQTSVVGGTLFSMLMLLNTCIKFYNEQQKPKSLQQLASPITNSGAKQKLIKVKTSNDSLQHHDSHEIKYVSEPQQGGRTKDLQADHYRRIFNSFPDGIIMLNSKKEVRFINYSLKKIMGTMNKRLALQKLMSMKNVQHIITELEAVNQMLYENSFKQQPSNEFDMESKSFFKSYDESRNDEASELKSTFHHSNTYENVRQMAEHLIDAPSNRVIKMICQYDEKSLFQVNFKSFDKGSVKPLENLDYGYLMLIVRDITTFNEISLLKQVIQDKSNLLSTVAHDFRTPLNSIKLMVQQIQPMCGEELIQKYILPILSQLDCFIYMVQDLLDAVVLNAGKFKLNIQQIQLHKLIKDCYNIMNIQALAKQNLLKIHFEEIPHIIYSDPFKIRQILINLLGNAMKFTSEGTITISGRIINRIVEITVTDTGLGIAHQNQEHLFKAFGKLDDPTNQNPQGIGLGLVISNALARKLSTPNIEQEVGLIVSSDGLGKGSQFSFQIYNFDEENQSIMYQQESLFKHQKTYFQPPENQVKQFDSFRMSGLDVSNYSKCQCPEILLVDDQPFILQALKSQLEGYGFKVHMAFNGFDCIKKVENFKQKNCPNCKNYKIIVMDLDMPGMSGIQTAQKLVKMNFQGRILGHSGYQGDKEKQDCLNAGMHAFFVKPLEINVLLQQIEQSRNL